MRDGQLTITTVFSGKKLSLLHEPLSWQHNSWNGERTRNLFAFVRRWRGVGAQPWRSVLGIAWLRRYSKNTSCSAVLWRRHSWRWPQNISCPQS